MKLVNPNGDDGLTATVYLVVTHEYDTVIGKTKKYADALVIEERYKRNGGKASIYRKVVLKQIIGE